MSVSGVTSTTPASLFDMASSTATTAAAKAKAKANASSSSSSSGNTGLDGTSTGSTFLNLLVKELQNQDPSAPMDSTQMVGQMISLNQLDQLISINQTLTSTTSSTGSASGQSSASQVAAHAALLNSATNSTAQAAGSVSDPNSTLDFSKLNTTFGGN